MYCSQVIDLLRHFHPERKGAYTVWGRMHEERKRNLGYRVDYILLAEPLPTSEGASNAAGNEARPKSNADGQVREPSTSQGLCRGCFCPVS